MANFISAPISSPRLYISPRAHHDLMDTFDSLLAAKAWAIQMLDALGKPASGIERGHFYFVGSYDQCYQTKPHIDRGDVIGNVKQTMSRDFGTRFCRADITISQSFIDSLNVGNILLAQSLSNKDLIEAQTKDPDIASLVKHVQNGTKPAKLDGPHSGNMSTYLRDWKKLVLIQGVLYRKSLVNGDERTQLVLPDELKNGVFKARQPRPPRKR